MGGTLGREERVRAAVTADRPADLPGGADAAEVRWTLGLATLLNARKTVIALVSAHPHLAHGALCSAVYHNHTGMVALLLAWRGPSGERVDPRAHGNEAITIAVEHRRDRVLGLLTSGVPPLPPRRL